MFGSAQFARDGTLRREIRRWWHSDPTWVVWLMLNPSKAGPSKNDPTALRVTHFTQAWGFTGWIGVNLYPLISSTPDRLWKWADWESQGPEWSIRDDLAANLEDIERAGRMATLRVAAFGAQPIEHDPMWLEQCLEAFQQPSEVRGGNERLFCLGVNKTGQPLHPMARGKLRVPDKTIPKLWRDL